MTASLSLLGFSGCVGLPLRQYDRILQDALHNIPKIVEVSQELINVEARTKLAADGRPRGVGINHGIIFRLDHRSPPTSGKDG